MSSAKSNWSAWLLAACAAGLKPAEFWRLSVREWRALAAPAPQMGRDAFDALAARFPDQHA